MKVLKAAHRASGNAKCNCGSELEFTIEDVDYGIRTYGRWENERIYNYIECPICKAKIELPEDLDSVFPWIMEE